MDYCGPRGIPRSHFLGGPQEWTDGDRAAALGWLLDQHSRCPNCGTYEDEWRGENKRPKVPPPYVPDTVRCLGCEALQQEQEEVARVGQKGRPQKGVRVILRPFDLETERERARREERNREVAPKAELDRDLPGLR